MRNLIIFLFLISSQSILLAQAPLNDDPCLAFELSPATDSDFDTITYTCLMGTLDDASPMVDIVGGCPEFATLPTVWYKIYTDDIAAQLFTTVTTQGNWTPIWSIFTSDDCNDLMPYHPGDAEPCSNIDFTPTIYQVGVDTDIDAYWVAITADPTTVGGDTINDPSFEICAATTIYELICFGDIETTDCREDSIDVRIVDREYDLPLDAPFCPGERVDIEMKFNYDSSESGADWFIGFVPIFGSGWDAVSLDEEKYIPIANDTTGVWHDEEGPCAPSVQERLPHMCTYTGPDGRLRLCNGLCQVCPCELGMSVSDPLPSGYFWTQIGGNAGCANDCSPATMWGIGSVTATVQWQFSIRTKLFDATEECLEDRSLQISVQTFSDGVAGCWEDPLGSCIVDELLVGPKWILNCETPNPGSVLSTQNVCPTDTLDLSGMDINSIFSEEIDTNLLRFESGILIAIAPGIAKVLVSNSSTVCNLPDTLVFNINDEYFHYEETTICIGQSYLGFDQTGIYDILSPSSGTCDSIFRLNLTVIEPTIVDEYSSFCTGDSVLFAGQYYYGEAIVADTIFTQGCIDTIHKLNITILTIIEIDTTLILCDGEAFRGYTETGLYSDTVTTDIGCDSIINISLTVEQIEIYSDSITICFYDEVVVNGITYTETGNYFDTIYSMSNCPVIINDIQLTVLEPKDSTFQASICQGEEILGYSVSGSYVVNLVTSEGCDSTILFVLTVLPADHPDCLIDAVGDPISGELKLYPNPTKSELYIKSSRNISDISIYDLSGREISVVFKIKKEYSVVELNHLPTGIYIVKIRQQNGLLTALKFVKM